MKSSTTCTYAHTNTRTYTAMRGREREKESVVVAIHLILQQPHHTAHPPAARKSQQTDTHKHTQTHRDRQRCFPTLAKLYFLWVLLAPAGWRRRHVDALYAAQRGAAVVSFQSSVVNVCWKRKATATATARPKANGTNNACGLCVRVGGMFIEKWKI